MPKFVPRQRKHRVKHRLKQNGGNSEAITDSNVMEIMSTTSNEKEEKRKYMKDAMYAGRPIISGKKKKRLEKYIVRLYP